MFKKKVTIILLSTLMTISTFALPKITVNAAAANGWQQNGAAWNYYVNGSKATSWVSWNSKWYYLKTDGNMATGWVSWNSNWYYLKAGGDMATGWISSNGKWYYLKSGGDMLASKWLTWNGKQYYLKAGGDMATNTSIDGWIVGVDGAWNGKPQNTSTDNSGAVTSVSLYRSEETLIIGATDKLIATVYPTNAVNKNLTWTSSNTSIVTVDNTGKITAIAPGTVTITATSVDGSKTAKCTINVANRTGYVYNTEIQIDLKVRSAANLNGTVVGYLYNYEKIEILDTIVDDNYIVWDKIIYNNSTAYVSHAYIQPYVSPPDSVVSISKSITKQFEVGSSNQIAGNSDGQGLSLGYLQWCIGQGTLQPLLNRMDREYNLEMRSIFGTNYDNLHKMILDTKDNQLKWANGINDSTNRVIEPWYSQFVTLTNNQHFINIEEDAEVYTVKQAMLICDKYNIKTVRGFALAFDIVTQNGSINPAGTTIIDTAIQQKPNMTEKDLLTVIANAVADSSANSEDIRSRKIAIVNGQGTVHGSMLYLDSSYGLSNDSWR